MLLALRDWTFAVRQIDGASLRRRHRAMERLAQLDPPESMRADHQALLEAWEARLHDDEPDPAVRVARGLEFRAALDELASSAGGDYGAEIDRLAKGATVESAQVGDQFEREGKQVLARAGRARPPTALDTEHQELVRLLRAYVSAQRELYDAVAQRDPDRAVALASEYGRAAAELKPVVDALYARARA